MSLVKQRKGMCGVERPTATFRSLTVSSGPISRSYRLGSSDSDAPLFRFDCRYPADRFSGFCPRKCTSALASSDGSI